MVKEDQVEEKMSMGERLQWLRERGVQVTTPEERHAGQVAEAMKQADSLVPIEDDEMDNEITYVMIPCDKSKPLVQQSFHPASVVKSRGSGDLLMYHLQLIDAFGGKKNEVDVDLLRETAQTTLASSDSAVPAVSDETLRKVAAESHVETFTLVHPTDSNQHCGMNIYLDEVGMLKRLPLNTRASDYAMKAGFNPPPQFYGDVFLGRIKSRPVLRNLSLELGKDTAMDAPWLNSAPTENLEHQLRMNQISGKSGAQQPAIAGADKAKDEDGYSWSQTEEELEVVVIVPSTTRSKDVKVKIRPQHIQVGFGKVEVGVKLFERVDVDGCTWTLESGDSDETKKLVLSLEKIEAAFWPRIRD